MELKQPDAQIFIPDHVPVAQAVRRTTHMAVAAHQDDLEMMAAAPILSCYQNPDQWFTGVVVTDGRGSPRGGRYQSYSDEEMRMVRLKEQFKAATIGEYSALILLDYPSKVIKDRARPEPLEDLHAVLQAAHSQALYIHNLADKHDTHVAVAVRVLQAARRLSLDERPETVYGCEIWRDLDWMLDDDKVLFDLSSHQHLQAALLAVFDSQISGGKQYDLAAIGRRRANATFFQPRETDANLGLSFGMDLTPLIREPEKDIGEYVHTFIRRFADDVLSQIKRFE